MLCQTFAGCRRVSSRARAALTSGATIFHAVENLHNHGKESKEKNFYKKTALDQFLFASRRYWSTFQQSLFDRQNARNPAGHALATRPSDGCLLKGWKRASTLSGSRSLNFPHVARSQLRRAILGDHVTR